MEIMKTENTGYPRYEELLLRRDRLRKEALILRSCYMREFGELITAVFRKKISCIQKKKTIAYCQMAINRGERIDQAELQGSIAREMREYHHQLEQMLRSYEASRQMEQIPEADVVRIKSLYRRLAKLLHPDINPRTEKVPELMKLWNRIVTAYEANKLEDLEAAEVLVNRALREQQLDGLELEIPDLEERMSRLETEIEEIRSTDPYQYKYLLEDEKLVCEKREALSEELREYEEYERELDEIMNGLLGEGVSITWRMN